MNTLLIQRPLPSVLILIPFAGELQALTRIEDLGLAIPANAETYLNLHLLV